MDIPDDPTPPLPFGPVNYTKMIPMPDLSRSAMPKIEDFTVRVADYPPFGLDTKIDIHALNCPAAKEIYPANLTVYNQMRADIMKQYQQVVRFMWKISISGMQCLDKSINDPKNSDIQRVPSPKKMAKYI